MKKKPVNLVPALVVLCAFLVSVVCLLSWMFQFAR